MPRWFYVLLVFSVLAVILDFLHFPPLVIFIVAALGIVPLAALIGKAVEDVAEHTGERIGGLLFATFGNATELIIGTLSLTKGLVSVVSASIIGSILGNALLVLGITICIGGFKHGRLYFDKRPANQYASLLALSIGGLLLPTIAELLASRTGQKQSIIVEHGVILSDFIAVLLLVGYIASILFSVFRVGDKGGTEEEEAEELELVVGARSMAAITRLLNYRRHVEKSAVSGTTGVLNQIDSTLSAIVSHEENVRNGGVVTQQGSEQNALVADKNSNVEPSSGVALTQGVVPQTQGQGVKVEEEKEEVKIKEEEKPSLWRGLVLLMLATVGVAFLSEILVGAIEPVTEVLHWNPAFVGLVFIPLIGGIPEYFNTISMALNKRIGMVLAASAGSSIQIALLIAPILVLVSLFTSQRLDLVFSLVELAVLALATFLFSEITRDGELVWLEGLLLILLYAMMGGTVFLFG
jgi:Ca2+:H+ antiporter